MTPKRYTMAYDYCLDGDPCHCNVEEDPEGFYVEYEDYVKLSAMYDEDMKRARMQPAECNLKDVTQRTVLHSLMNLHMSWIIKLCMYLDCGHVHIDMIKLREFFANRIDQKSKEAS